MVHAFSKISLDHELILLSFAPSKQLQTSSWLACAYYNLTSMAFSKERCPDDKDLQLAFSFRKDEESHVAMLVAISPPPPFGVGVAKHRAPVLQTCGLGRASSDTSKNFRFEVQSYSWKTVIGTCCPPAPQSYRCHVILTEPRGSANQIILKLGLKRVTSLFNTNCHCRISQEPIAHVHSLPRR